MVVDRKALKHLARASLRQTRPRPALIALVLLLLTYVLNMVLSFVLVNPVQLITAVLGAIEGGMSQMEAAAAAATQLGKGSLMMLFLQILLALFGTVLGFGFFSYCLHCAKGQSANLGSLIEGFGMVGRVLLLGLLLVAHYLVFGFLCTIPASVFIQLAGPWGQSLSGLILAAALVVLLFLMLRYAMAPFLLADHPELSAMDAIRGSRVLMRNRQGELLVLMLSFFGWLVLEFVVVMVVTYGASFAFALWVVGRYGAVESAISALQLAPGLFGGIYAVIVAMLLSVLPLLLFLLPYVGTTLAHFYCMLSAPPVPPAGAAAPNV